MVNFPMDWESAATLTGPSYLCLNKHINLSSYSDLRVKEGWDPEVLLCHSEGQVVVTGNVVRIKSVEL